MHHMKHSEAMLSISGQQLSSTEMELWGCTQMVEFQYLSLLHHKQVFGAKNRMLLCNRYAHLYLLSRSMEKKIKVFRENPVASLRTEPQGTSLWRSHGCNGKQRIPHM